MVKVLDLIDELPTVVEVLDVDDELPTVVEVLEVVDVLNPDCPTPRVVGI